MNRISFDEMRMRVAFVVAQRSTCVRGQIGAVLTCNQIILSVGHNGTPAGEPHCACDSAADNRPCPVSVHAEMNAILVAARNSISPLGSCLYVTHNPCYQCSGHIINAGVSQVVYALRRIRSAAARGLDRLANSGITVTQYDMPDFTGGTGV